MEYKFFDNPVVKLVERDGIEGASKTLGITVKALSEKLVTWRAKEDGYFFDKESLKIRTKEGLLTPLIQNAGQKKLQASVDRQRALGKPVRIKLPKARQFGGSTKAQGLFYRDCIYQEHIQTLTVCHDLDSARNMRAMFERYHQHFPRQKPKIKKVSEKWWRFPDKDIDYIIDTADELDTGRSFTIHRLHISEVAFYRDPEVLMTGLLRAVPNSPNTIIIAESTANGVGGWWYDFINRENDYELVFVGWNEVEEYTRPFYEDKEKIELDRTLTKYEQGLIDTYSLTFEQLNWRRHEINNGFNGDEMLFMQEFPITVEESFLSSGRPFFPVQKVRENISNSQKIELKKGFLELGTDNKVEFVEDKSGWWTITDMPARGHNNRYVSGSDSAEGKIVNESKRLPDRSVCTVYDRMTNSEVASFTAVCDTDVFGNEIYKANLFYGTVCDAVERNSSGIGVIQFLKEKDSVYLYRRAVIGKEDDTETFELGWQTNTQSRDTLLSHLRTRIREGTYKSKNKEFWLECSKFVYDEKGVPKGVKNEKDDRVFSAALALQAEHQANELSLIAMPLYIKTSSPDTDKIFQSKQQEDVDIRAIF